MRQNLIKYVLVTTLLFLGRLDATHYLTDSEMSLASHAQRGEFTYSPDTKALIAWADEENLYSRCGIQSIERLSDSDRAAIIEDLTVLLKADLQSFSKFSSSLANSELDNTTKDKVLVILYAYLLDAR